MPNPLIELRQVKMAWPSFRLDIDHLEVFSGEILRVTGSNGSGKTTLLSILHLLRKPHKGEVLFDGHPVCFFDRSALLKQCRHIGSILQEPVLLRGQVLNNVALPLILRGTGRKDAYRAAMPWLERMGLEEMARRPIQTLSGGQARRALFARALIHQPRILLLDEPFSGLDREWRATMRRELSSLVRDAKTGLVLVSHDEGDESLRGDRLLEVVNVCPPSSDPRDMENHDKATCSRTSSVVMMGHRVG